MRYTLEICETTRRDFKALSPEIARRVVFKLEAMREDLAGDVKRLVGHTVGYRLRVGDYRVLFDISGTTLLIRRVTHRSKAYD